MLSSGFQVILLPLVCDRTMLDGFRHIATLETFAIDTRYFPDNCERKICGMKGKSKAIFEKTGRSWLFRRQEGRKCAVLIEQEGSTVEAFWEAAIVSSISFQLNIVYLGSLYAAFTYLGNWKIPRQP